MVNTNKECNGCRHIVGCLLRYNMSPISRCPCSTCLVKMICKTQCDERTNLFDEATEERIKELSKRIKRSHMKRIKDLSINS